MFVKLNTIEEISVIERLLWSVEYLDFIFYFISAIISLASAIGFFNIYLHVQIFARLNGFRRVLARAIARLSG